MRRRSFVSGSILVAAGVSLLAGCRGGSGPGADGGGVSGGGTGSVAASPAPAGFQELDGHLLGHHLVVRVSPVVRVSDAATALVVELIRAADDAAAADVQSSESGSDDGDDAVYARTSLGRPPMGPGADGVRLVDPAGAGRVWTAGSASGGTLKLRPGETVSSTVVFTPVDLDEVTVFVPQTGFVRVRVIDRDAADAGVSPEALGKADKIIQDEDGPGDRAAVVPLERYTRALDDSVGTRTTDRTIAVTLSSDVTFESDSYNLTGKADAQLQTVASQLARYPDGGALDVVGHTDDVADDAHNQTLSENRATAVKDRLGQLADLGKWQVSTTGKGESEPAVKDTTDEARAANRRVVITLTPTSGTQTSTATPSAAGTPADSSGSGLPEPKGPVADGPDGVTVNGPDNKGQLTITLPQVVRTGGLLLGQLTVTTGPGPDTNLTAWLTDRAQAFASSRGENGGISAGGMANGLTLLADGQRIYPADYLPPDSTWHHPMTEMYTYESLKEGATTTICVAWPDTAQDTLTLDHPPAKNSNQYAFRLTDIPVTES